MLQSYPGGFLFRMFFSRAGRGGQCLLLALGFDQLDGNNKIFAMVGSGFRGDFIVWLPQPVRLEIFLQGGFIVTHTLP